MGQGTRLDVVSRQRQKKGNELKALSLSSLVLFLLCLKISSPISFFNTLLFISKQVPSYGGISCLFWKSLFTVYFWRENIINPICINFNFKRTRTVNSQRQFSKGFS